MTDSWPHLDLPHPPGRRPIIGDLGATDGERPLQSMLELARDMGPIFELRIFRSKMVMVQSPALAAELCDEARFEKKLLPGVAALRETAGDGLFTAHSQEKSWRLAHDLLRPAFTRPAMQGYHGTMNAVCSELVDAWDRAPGPVDVSPSLTRMTLETIGRTSFSHDFGSFERPELHPFVAAMVVALRRGQTRSTAGMIPGGRLLLRRGEAEYQRSRQVLEDLLDRIIADRVAADDGRTDDLLGLMLHTAHEESGEKLDLVNVRHQVLTFLVAGHETTSGALSFALYYLTRHPEALRAAQAETDAVLGSDPAAEPTFEQVPKLRYVRRCLDEALRLWPTAPGFGRGPRHGPELLGGRYPMRHQDSVAVLIPAIHRDAAVWGPAAQEFDPDHFLPAAVRSRPAHTYFPFGTGERACIGRQFALHEAVLVLARLLHRYDMTPDPDYELRISERLTLMPEDFRLTLSRRVPSGAVEEPKPAPV